MSAGDGKPEIHPPVESGTSQNKATAELLSDAKAAKPATSNPAIHPSFNANSFGMVNLSTNSLLDSNTPIKRNAIKTGWGGAADFAVNFADGGVRNLANIGDQTIRSIKDPLSAFKDIGTAGKTIIENPTVVKNMATEMGTSLIGGKGAGEAGSSWGNAVTTVGILFVGGKGALRAGEAGAVEGANSIEAKIAQTNRLLSSAESSGVKIGTEMGSGMTAKLETTVDGLVAKAPLGGGLKPGGLNLEFKPTVELPNAPKPNFEFKPNLEVKPTEVKPNLEVKPTEVKPNLEVKPTEVKPNLEVKPTEVKPTEVKPTEVKPTEVKPNEVKPNEVKPNEVKPNEVKPNEVKPNEVKPNEVKPNEVKPDAEVKPNEVKPNEVKPDAEVKPNEVKPSEVKPDAEVKPNEVKPNEVKPNEVKPNEVKPDAEVKPNEVKPNEVKPNEVKPDAEVKPNEVKPNEVKPSEVKPDAEVKPNEVKPNEVKPDAEVKPNEVKPNEVKPSEVKPDAEVKPNEVKPNEVKPDAEVKPNKVKPNEVKPDAEVKPNEVKPNEVKPDAEVKPNEVKPNEVKPNEVKPDAEVKPNEVKPNEVKPDAEVKPNEVKPNEVKPNEVKPEAEVKPNEVKPNEVKPNEVKPDAEVKPNEVKPNEVKPNEVKPDAEVKPNEVKPNEVKPNEVKPNEVKPNEVKPNEVKPNEVKPNEVKPNEVKPDAEVKPNTEPNPQPKEPVPGTNPRTVSPEPKPVVEPRPQPQVEPLRPEPVPHNETIPARPNETVPTRPSDMVPGETTPKLHPGDVAPAPRPGDVTPAPRPGDATPVPREIVPGTHPDSPVLPKDAPLTVPPADHPQIKNLSDQLDKIPATVPGATDAQDKLNQFISNPSLESYKNLSDSLRVLSPNAPAIHEQIEAAVAAARQQVVAHAVADTSKSIENLLSSASSRVGSLPSGVQEKAQDLLQQMRAASQALVGAELASGQRAAISQLQSSTYDLMQLLTRSKGAQSEVENALLQVTHAQRDLAAANYLARTGDTFAGQVVDFLKYSPWVNALGATAVGLELRSLLGTVAQSMDAEVKKLQDSKNEATPEGDQKPKQATNDDTRSSSLFLNSKDPTGQPAITVEARQQAHNHSMYGGIDVQWTYYQKGAPGQVVEEETRPSSQINRPMTRIFTGDQQDKTSAPRFDYVKTRMPSTRMAADGPYLSAAGIAFRPGAKNINGQRGSGNNDPNSANSLMSKNYAFVVGPTQSPGSASSRYGGPAPGSEASEKQNRDGQSGGGTATVQAPAAISSAVAQNDPANSQPALQAKQNIPGTNV